ncbi:hypothetical protein, partial [Streptomyces sp. SID8380]|uniref:hypothetical protein n=1 Tax=Streptomyces sp. SID8380 TaxID=2690360 RepID=UPI0013C9F898
MTRVPSAPLGSGDFAGVLQRLGDEGRCDDGCCDDGLCGNGCRDDALRDDGPRDEDPRTPRSTPDPAGALR